MEEIQLRIQVLSLAHRRFHPEYRCEKTESNCSRGRGRKERNDSPLTCSNKTDMTIVMFYPDFCNVAKRREESEVGRG